MSIFAFWPLVNGYLIRREKLLSKVLAVIATETNPRQLVQTDGVDYWLISGVNTLGDALRMRLHDFRAALDGPIGEKVAGRLGVPISDEIEIWGAGVTYLRSRDARKEESGMPDVYQRVYEADRPEIFLKSTAIRCVGDGDKIGMRGDASATVPEPEVVIVINRYEEIIGLTICNDVTARSIEGENPLYLSQAKIYIGSTSMGPTITPSWNITEYKNVGIRSSIERNGATVWKAQTSLGDLNRTFEDLVSYLFRCQVFPDGVVLSTGTGIIPPLDVALEEGDIVSITVDEVGTLTNQVEIIPIDSNARANETEGKA
ncbi:MAG: fumarylacetoacetate hydrolase family protein [Actinobacteria bacterium]|nr:fumarylacetoacetate hydrolase family protein [Actinomycetota bacterium]